MRSQKSKKYIHDLKWFFFIWVLGCFGTTFSLYAQQSSTKFKTLSSLEGLSSSLAWTIAQDKHGFIWIGTIDGLNLFNGYDFKTYRHQEDDSTSIGHNYINNLLFDKNDRLWIGTQGGVDLYNAEKDEFIHYSPALKPGSTSPNIFWIYEDLHSRIWIGTSDGINLFNEETNQFESNSLPEEAGISSQILALLQDKSGQYWIGSKEGLYTWIPEKKSYKKFAYKGSQSASLDDHKINALFEDSRGNIWIGTSGGIGKITYATNTLTHYKHDPGNPHSLSHNRVNSIAEGRDGALWVGTYEGGLNKFNPSSQSFERFFRDSKDPFSLADNAVKDVLVDQMGGIWVATFRGVSFADRYQMQFDILEHKAYDPFSLTDNYISALFKDSEGNIWSGNRYGISLFNPEQNNFTHFKHNPEDSSTIADGAILNISEDTEGTLWSVTHTGIVNKFDRKRKIFKRYHPNPEDPGSIRPRSSFVYCTRDGNVWVKSAEGISKYNKENDNFSLVGKPGSSQRGQINLIFEDSKGNFWVTNQSGIYLFDREKGSFYLKQELPEEIWPFLTTQIFEDRNQNLWIGSDYKGFIFYNSVKDTFEFYSDSDNLPEAYVKGILQDKEGNLWISSNNGLFQYDPDSSEYKEFGFSDGLKNKEFNLGACVRSDDGRLFFGGRNGISVFCPESILKNPHPPKVVITDFQLFNKKVPIGENSPLKASVSETDYLELSYKENVFSFEFVALNYNSPEKNQYAYKMEGFEDEWNFSGTRRHATYTNLPSGKTYTFKVKASNNDGIWNEEGTSVQIYIKPPFWLTWWFYSLVSCFVLLLLYGLYRWRTRQLYLQRKKLARMVKERTKEVESQKEALAAHATYLKTANQEIKIKNKKIRRQASKLKIIDQLKSRFLENISHEFRTPLTLILVPLEEMISATAVNPDTKAQLSIMNRNARRLLQLINQLLDLSKLENGSVPMELTNQNIVQFLRSLSQSFQSLARKHQINYQFFSAKEKIFTSFDQDKVEKIGYNLISNAFKFTPDGGNIHVGLTEIELTESELKSQDVHQGKYVKITVSDSGPGISPDHLPYIFDRFYQGEECQLRKNNGTGIGLALTKELVELHGGKIKVDSQAGQGTCFSVLLPIIEQSRETINERDSKMPPFEASPERDETAEEVSTAVLPLQKDAPLLLVVEDNKDLRQQIKRIFSKQFRVEEAENGQEGWDSACKYMPDLIISDIMMPIKDGIALCKQLKSDPATSHIPTILLSARIDGEEAGLTIGADDFITKPFNAKSLVLKVRNLLETRQKFREAICNELGLTPLAPSKESASVNPQDTLFLEKATETALQHLKNTNFEMETLYRSLGMSRTLVYKKMKSLTGLGPNEFIRQIRLNKASQLLQQGNISVGEVMEQAGFNHRSYFVKCFKNRFGHLPSEHNNSQEALAVKAGIPDQEV